MKNITIISNARGCFIELTHHDSDPGTWIVRRWRKFLWFKKQISSHWFNDEHQAIAFAHELKREHNGHSGHF
ncbi:MAG: hypothetical protein HY707_03020 [Ignavibacteriae bacterium]|nr:hypothetical protein [Ignavibacteriota bacterium]